MDHSAGAKLSLRIQVGWPEALLCRSSSIACSLSFVELEEGRGSPEVSLRNLAARIFVAFASLEDLDHSRILSRRVGQAGRIENVLLQTR